jgi:glutamate mutase epsilon subunit
MKKTMKDTSEKRASYTKQEVKDQAYNILEVWKANREFRMQDAKFEDFDKVYAEFDELLKKIEARSRELKELKTDREKLAAKLSLLNTRARSGMCGYFGPQSPEFAHVKVRLSKNKAIRAAQKAATAESELPPTPTAPETTNPQP